MFKKKIIQRAMDTPLSDEECQIRVSIHHIKAYLNKK